MRHINLHLVRLKPAYFLLTLLASILFAVSVLSYTPVSADDGHGGAPGHLHQLPQPCDSVSDSDKAACEDRQRQYYEQILACGNQACKDRARESWQAWLADHEVAGDGTPTYTVTDNPDCAEQDKLSLDWDFNNDGCTNTSDLITITFRLLAGIVGIAVVGGITWGGMLYASSNGNASKAQQGITVIVNAVIGLLLFIFMFAITNFLVPGGVIG